LTSGDVHINQGSDDAVSRLLDAAEHGRMVHVVAQLQRERQTAEKAAAAVAALGTQGITVTDERPTQYATPYRLDALLNADGQPLTAETHQDCPGHAVTSPTTTPETFRDPLLHR
jgi:ParB family chromosome partitioning protein